MSTPLVDAIITETPPAELLRAVAARMRELADAATPGTWSHNCMGSHGCQVYNDGRLREHKSVAFFGRKEWKADHADAAYVAAFQPAVAKATAQLLDQLAGEADHLGATPLVMYGQEVARAFMDAAGWQAYVMEESAR